MSSLLYRLARFCTERAGRVLVLWIVLVAALGGALLTIGSTTSSAISIPGTESQQALERLQQEFPQAAGTRGTIVFRAPEGQTLANPQLQQAVAAATAEAAAVPGVLAAVDPFVSKALTPDGRYALMQVQFGTGPDEITDEQRAAYAEVGREAEALGITVERGGEVQITQVEIGAGEAIGVLVALAVLVVTFGSLITAGMTMLNALIGVGVGMTGLFLLSNTFEMTNTAPILALMLGLAVGIDYSLFITSRHRQHLAEGLPPKEAAARAVGTAGSAVLFAGLTVVIALASLAIVGIPFLAVMGFAAAGTVAVAVLIALTLLPAILTLAGGRIAPKKAKHESTPATGFRWAGLLTRYRVPAILVALVGLGVLAVPATDLRLALPDGGAAPVGSDRRAAYDLISEGFGPGFNGQLSLVLFTDSAQQTQQVTGEVVTALTGKPGVVAVVPGGTSQSGRAAIIQVIPTTGPTSAATERLVVDIRDDVRPIGDRDGVDISATGSTAVGIDVSEKLSAALPIYLLVVVGLSFLLLMLVFRSLLVPLKATLGFLLTIAATFGATVAVFQWGWFGDVVNLSSTGPLVSFLPILLIGILFGLAMDYEVFLVSRMREDFVHGAAGLDPTERAKRAAVSGFGHGARVVTAAAVIMTAVFAGFVATDDSIIKSMGFALAFGVLIDAFVVRMTVVPAVMSLLGRHAWYLPRWLDRILPDIDLEGEKLRRRFAAADAEPDRDPVRV